MHRRPQRCRQVDAAGNGQRTAAPAPWARSAFGGQVDLGAGAPADPGPRNRARAAGAQPVRGHDRARERRDGRVHDQRPRARGAAAEDRGGALPDRPRAGRREGRQPVRGTAAAGRVRPLHDARPDADRARRAFDGTRPADPAGRVRDGRADEQPGQDDPAGGAERARGTQAQLARRSCSRTASCALPAPAARCSSIPRSAPCTSAGR